MKTIFIAGIPGSGKTCFGDWLRDTKGYVHIDMEAFSDPALHQTWNTCLVTKEFKPFMEEISKHQKPVVLTWGFPPTHLSIICKLQTLGVRSIWFDAPEILARDSFLHRNTAAESDFNRQIDEIRRNQKALLDFFDKRCITVMLGRRYYRDREDIFTQIQSLEE